MQVANTLSHSVHLFHLSQLPGPAPLAEHSPRERGKEDGSQDGSTGPVATTAPTELSCTLPSEATQAWMNVGKERKGKGHQNDSGNTDSDTEGPIVVTRQSGAENMGKCSTLVCAPVCTCPDWGFFRLLKNNVLYPNKRRRYWWKGCDFSISPSVARFYTIFFSTLEIQ